MMPHLLETSLHQIGRKHVPRIKKKIITINGVNQKETLTAEILFYYHDV